MSGAIVSVHVSQGQTVAADDLLVVMEAMKLIHQIVAPAAGKVAKVCCQEGQIVTTGAPLIELEPAADSPHPHRR